MLNLNYSDFWRFLFYFFIQDVCEWPFFELKKLLALKSTLAISFELSNIYKEKSSKSIPY